MLLPASARRRKRKPITADTPRDTWTLELRGETFRFSSLSQMHRWLRSNPVQDHELVVMRRNGRIGYTGLWGGGLSDAPTLL